MKLGFPELLLLLLTLFIYFSITSRTGEERGVSVSVLCDCVFLFFFQKGNL